MRNTGVGIPAPVFLIGQSFVSKQAGILSVRMSHDSLDKTQRGQMFTRHALPIRLSSVGYGLTAW